MERAEGAKGGDPDEGYDIASAILGGEPGPRRDIVPVNAAGRAKSFEEGMALAAESLDSGDTRGAGISD